MKFITARDFRTRPGQIWKSLIKEKTMTVTINGKPVAMLLATSPEKYEESIDTIRKIRAEKALLSMQGQAMSKGLNTLPDMELEKEIKLARKAKAR